MSWTVLGWHELGRWLSLLSLQGSLRDSVGYSLTALVTHVGLGRAVADVLTVVLGCMRSSEPRRFWAKAGQEKRLFGVLILLTIVISPEVDSHYFAMLLVPLAITRPRLSWAWLTPLLLWLCPATASNLWQSLVWWSLVGAVASSVGVLSGEERQDVQLAQRPQPV